MFDFLAAGLSDSEAEDAELLVALAVGKAFVLGLLDGAFLAFFFDFSSELLVAEEAELFELFLDFEESCEFEESSESLEESSLPDDEDDEELEEELEDELPDDAEEEALLEPARFGGIFHFLKVCKSMKKLVCFYFDLTRTLFSRRRQLYLEINFGDSWFRQLESGRGSWHICRINPAKISRISQKKDIGRRASWPGRKISQVGRSGRNVKQQFQKTVIDGSLNFH